MKHATIEQSYVVLQPYLEPTHEASIHDAGNGQGTIQKWPLGKTLDHPVLDGSTQSWKSEHDTENPWRGLIDPGLIRHPAHARGTRWHWFWE